MASESDHWAGYTCGISMFEHQKVVLHELYPTVLVTRSRQNRYEATHTQTFSIEMELVAIPHYVDDRYHIIHHENYAATEDVVKFSLRK